MSVNASVILENPTAVILGLDPRTHSDTSKQRTISRFGWPKGMGPRVKPEDDEIWCRDADEVWGRDVDERGVVSRAILGPAS